MHPAPTPDVKAKKGVRMDSRYPLFTKRKSRVKCHTIIQQSGKGGSGRFYPSGQP